MDRGLNELLALRGGVFETENRPAHFGDPTAELRAAAGSVALFERSDLGRVLGSGPDLLDLLQRLSTGDVAALTPGDGGQTVLTTAKGRIVERLFVHHLGQEGVLMVTGRDGGDRVRQHLDRFTFAERTGLADVTAETFQLALIGPAGPAAVRRLGFDPPTPSRSTPASVGECTVQILGQDGASTEGLSVFGRRTDACAVWRSLEEAVTAEGGRIGGEIALESFRVLAGLPASGHELTDEHNPLEAGLWDAVSFDKGCYVGQEVVARLRTYDKVSRSIVGLALDPATPPPDPGTPLYSGERPVGVLTSAVRPPGYPATIGLGYVKRRELADLEELQVGSGGPTARLVELPVRLEG